MHGDKVPGGSGNTVFTVLSGFSIERGFKVYGVGASPTIVAAFRERFPNVAVECAAVEDSDFFARTFDGVVAWGLFFLLDAEVRRRLVRKIGGVLQSGGRLLFTAPNETGSFPPDVMTGRPQFSLGCEEHRKALEAKACHWLEQIVMKAKTTTTFHRRCNSP
jgi:SAM-dependent methyltransferase